MAYQKFTPYEYKELITKVVSKIQELSHDHWVSVTDHSLSDIASEIGLHRSIMTQVVEVLSEQGFIMVEGIKSAMRYKWPQSLIKDASIFSEEIYNRWKAAQKESRDNCRPKKKQLKEEIKEESPMQVLRRESLPLGLKVYFSSGMNIFEGIIYAAQYSQDVETMNKVFYKIRFYANRQFNPKDINIEPIYPTLGKEKDKQWFVTQYVCKSFFGLTLEELLENMKRSINNLPNEV